MNLLRNRLICPYSRSFSTNSYGYSLSNDQKSGLEQPISSDDPASPTDSQGKAGHILWLEVDMAQLTARENKIVQAIIAVVQKHPHLDAEFIPEIDQQPFSGYLRLFGDWGSVQRPVYLSWRITPQQAKLLLFQLRTLQDMQPLLLADYVTETLAGQLQQQQTGYLDTVGNGWLCAPPLFYEVSGRRKKGPKLLPNRSQQGVGSKVIYQLLKDEQLCNQPYRTIARRAQVALGAVGPVIKELLEKKLLADDVNGQRHVVNATALRQLWETGYLNRLRPKLQVERCRFNGAWNIDTLPLLIREQRLEDQVLIGGELAASFYCENVQAQSATLHLSAQVALKQMLQLRLIPCDDGPITIVEKFADNNAFGQRSPEGLQLADPLLVRCELLYSDMPQHAQLATALEQLYLPGGEAPIAKG